MEDFIKEMVELYVNEKATWSEIQDIVEGKTWVESNSPIENFKKSNEVLEKIENKIRKAVGTKIINF